MLLIHINVQSTWGLHHHNEMEGAFIQVVKGSSPPLFFPSPLPLFPSPGLQLKCCHSTSEDPGCRLAEQSQAAPLLSPEPGRPAAAARELPSSELWSRDSGVKEFPFCHGNLPWLRTEDRCLSKALLSECI